MIDVGDLTVTDASGATVPLHGELLCFVEHAFTDSGERVLRLAARAHRAGGRYRVISVDSPVALAAWVAAVGVAVPVGADVSGDLARRLGRFDDETCAFRPGWAQIDRGGHAIVVGETEFPAGTIAPPEGVHPESPRAAANVPAWVFYAAAAALAVAAIAVYARDARTGDPVAVGAAEATPVAKAGVAAPSAPRPPREPAKGGGSGTKGAIGGGWYAVPPALAGKQVRWTGTVLEVEGAELAKPPMACLSETTPMTGAVHVKGSWELDHVGTPGSKGARVALRLLDANGTMLPQGVVPGGSQVFIANGRLVADWAAFDKVVPANEAATQVRLCVDNQGGTGVVRVRDVSVGVE